MSSTARTGTGSADTFCIREVWAFNLEEEFQLIRDIVDDYPYVAMDTEFPGVVVRPVGTFRNNAEYNYNMLRDNVNLLKLIQLGLTFTDQKGNLPRFGANQQCVWQFNFREFNINSDMHNPDSIELLKQSGVDFRRNEETGIDSSVFGELFMSSGVVLNENVQWISFHGGYDFGYLLKLLKCRDLPQDEAEFFKLLRTYFPTVYDIKYLIRFSNQTVHGGLNKIAELLQVPRVGPSHQAGSDSLLTSCIFWKLQQGFFNGPIDQYAGVLFGLGVDNGE